jgi:hypothetical protein
MVPISRLEFVHENGFGRITDGDILYAPVKAWITAPMWGLENGWAPNEWSSEGDWFQARMTRVAVGSPAPKPPHHSKVSYGVSATIDPEVMARIHAAYIAHRGFSDHLPISETYGKREPTHKRFITFTSKASGEMVAFTLMRLFHADDRVALSSLQFSWDYADPRLSLGRLSAKVERQIAAEMGADYLYLGPGYQIACRYKAAEEGFEWWTGQEWSNDIDTYIRLCSRDDSIKTLDDIDALDP